MRAQLLHYDLILTHDINNDPISKSGHILSFGGLELHHISLWDTIQPATGRKVAISSESNDWNIPLSEIP